MKRILWVSRHPPTPEHSEYLEHHFKDEIFIDTWNKGDSNTREVINRYRKGNYDDLVLVLPMELIGKICKAGIHPIRPVYKVVSLENENVRNYTFLRFERIRSVTVERETLRTRS